LASDGELPRNIRIFRNRSTKTNFHVVDILHQLLEKADAFTFGKLPCRADEDNERVDDVVTLAKEVLDFRPMGFECVAPSWELPTEFGDWLSVYGYDIQTVDRSHSTLNARTNALECRGKVVHSTASGVHRNVQNLVEHCELTLITM
jgi:hypothetical protein